jgi:glycosyltransferase involved in cell wall biosynthesis
MVDSPAETVGIYDGDFDVFADLTNGAEAAHDALIRQYRLCKQAQLITCVVDPNAISVDGIEESEVRICATGMPVAALAEAIESARFERRNLLVLIGGIAGSDVVGRLAAAFDVDPMIGFALPRFAHPDGGDILPLPSATAEKLLTGYSHNILRYLPILQLAPEFVAACVLIRGQLVANFPAIDQRFSTVAAALHQLMTWSRRRGYRVAIVNHAVIVNPTSCLAYPVPNFEERALLREHYPDLARAGVQFGNLPCHQREALLALAVSSMPDERQRLLLDCRGMQAGFNGTSECILGLLNGLSLLNTGWSITVLTSAAASSFHKLQERYRQFNIVWELPEGLYTVAIKLSQPWKFQDLIDLHHRALFVAVNMLDTIAWDIMMAGADVEDLWSFVAKYLDGIMYISGFTRDRFNFRFPVARDVREAVTHLSFCYEDYMGVSIRTSADGGHILLVGNQYDHKGIDQAIDFLASAFPNERFIIVGSLGKVQANAEYISSGKIPHADIDELYAGAKMLIFPSFYEGFGFPVVKGLSYGLDVVARRSTLLSELACHCAANGRIVPFDDPHSLVIAVGQILAGKPVETLPLGGAIDDGAEPLNWRDVASRMMDLVDGLTAEISTRQYDARDSALRLRLVRPLQDR